MFRNPPVPFTTWDEYRAKQERQRKKDERQKRINAFFGQPT